MLSLTEAEAKKLEAAEVRRGKKDGTSAESAKTVLPPRGWLWLVHSSTIIGLGEPEEEEAEDMDPPEEVFEWKPAELESMAGSKLGFAVTFNT